MPAWGEFTVTDPLAPDRVVAPAIAAKAGEIRTLAAARTPVLTGRLRAAWTARPESPTNWRVENDVEYARSVEYGGIHNPHPRAMLGQAIAIASGTGLRL